MHWGCPAATIRDRWNAVVFGETVKGEGNGTAADRVREDMIYRLKTTSALQAKQMGDDENV
jgi:hypothetical protein